MKCFLFLYFNAIISDDSVFIHSYENSFSLLNKNNKKNEGEEKKWRNAFE